MIGVGITALTVMGGAMETATGGYIIMEMGEGGAPKTGDGPWL